MGRVSCRRAELSDLSAIYDIQNVPFREKVFAESLPPRDQFIQQVSAAIGAGEEMYYILQDDERIIGYIRFEKHDTGWQFTVWGKWLKTLIYAASEVAFRHLGLDHIGGFVRKDLKRMNHIYEEYRIRKLGESSVFYTSEEPPYVRKAVLVYYDFRADEFFGRYDFFQGQALPVDFTQVEPPPIEKSRPTDP